MLPQIVYYVSSYCELLATGKIEMGEKINLCVPTGNFGNILAGYYAKRMGVPVKTLICASNANNVLTEFIETGVYDRNRPFYQTASPSMDILISSNLERLLYLLSGSDEAVRGYMQELSQTGRYELAAELAARVREDFACGCCDDTRTLATIGRVFQDKQYLLDTHTAVAYTVLEDYREKTHDDTVTVLASTASPFKFCTSVLDALGVHEFAAGTGVIDQLAAVSGRAAPIPLASLAGKTARFDGQTKKEHMPDVVTAFLR